MNKLEKAIEYADKLWKQQPNEFGIMPDLGNEFMWVVDFMTKQEVELKTLKKEVEELKSLITSIKNICNKPSEQWITSLAEISDRYTEINILIDTYTEEQK